MTQKDFEASNLELQSFYSRPCPIFRTWHLKYGKSTAVTLELHLRCSFAPVVESTVIVW